MGSESELNKKRSLVDRNNERVFDLLVKDMPGGLRLARETRRLAEEIDYTRGILDSRHEEGWHFIFACDFDRAFSLLKDLPEEYGLEGDLYGEMKALNANGALHLDMGDYDNALPYFSRALEMSREYGESEREAVALANLGLVYTELARGDEAFGFFCEALNVHDISYSAFHTSVKGIGLYYKKNGNFGASKRVLHEALEHACRNSEIFFETELLGTLGVVCRESGSYEESLEHHKRALSLSVSLGNRKIETENLLELGRLFMKTHRVELALENIEKALLIAREKKIRFLVCQCYKALSQLHEHMGNYPEALACLKAHFAAEKDLAGEKTRIRMKSMEFEHQIQKSRQQAEIFRLKNIELKKKTRELEIANERILHLANHDALTGLPNRRLFVELMKSAVAAAHRKQKNVAILFIDLDDFKPVNDTFGHRAGDQILSAVARRFKDCLRKSDTVARFGGDEFVIMLPDVESRDHAAEVAGKILAVFQQPFPLDDRLCRLGASIGISIFPDDDTGGDGLMLKADKAMYQAKMCSKNNYRFYCYAADE